MNCMGRIEYDTSRGPFVGDVGYPKSSLRMSFRAPYRQDA